MRLKKKRWKDEGKLNRDGVNGWVKKIGKINDEKRRLQIIVTAEMDNKIPEENENFSL